MGGGTNQETGVRDTVSLIGMTRASERIDEPFETKIPTGPSRHPGREIKINATRTHVSSLFDPLHPIQPLPLLINFRKLSAKRTRHRHLIS